MMARLMAKGIKPRLLINEKDGKWVICTETIFKTMTIEFTLNVEFEETTGDGRELKVTIYDCNNGLNRIIYFSGVCSI